MSNVEHPSHYNVGNIEVIDAIEDWGMGRGFNRGNAIKYIARAGHKDTRAEVEDLCKAKWYIEREIMRLGDHYEIEKPEDHGVEAIDEGLLNPTAESVRDRLRMYLEDNMTADGKRVVCEATVIEKALSYVSNYYNIVTRHNEMVVQLRSIGKNPGDDMTDIQALLGQFDEACSNGACDVRSHKEARDEE